MIAPEKRSRTSYPKARCRLASQPVAACYMYFFSDFNHAPPDEMTPVPVPVSPRASILSLVPLYSGVQLIGILLAARAIDGAVT